MEDSLIKKSEWIKLQLSRGEAGVKIHVRSERIAAWMKANATGRWIEQQPWPGRGCRLIQNPEIANTTFADWGRGLYEDEKINLSFLRSESLAEGYTLEFQGVFSKEKLTGAIGLMKAGIVAFIKEYLKPVDLLLRVTSEEVI